MSLFKRNKRTYSMDIKQAGETLHNIFAACEQEPNKVPFDKIVLRQKANTKMFTIGKYISILFIIFLFIAPFLFPHSEATITAQKTSKSTLELESHLVKDEFFIMTFYEDNINYKNSFAVTANGDKLLPVMDSSVDGTIVFPYMEIPLNIYVYDTDGNYIQFVLTPTN